MKTIRCVLGASGSLRRDHITSIGFSALLSTHNSVWSAVWLILKSNVTHRSVVLSSRFDRHGVSAALFRCRWTFSLYVKVNIAFLGFFLYPRELHCLYWSVTVKLTISEHRRVALDIRHALYLCIIGFRRYRFGEDFVILWTIVHDSARCGLVALVISNAWKKVVLRSSGVRAGPWATYCHVGRCALVVFWSSFNSRVALRAYTLDEWPCADSILRGSRGNGKAWTIKAYLWNITTKSLITFSSLFVSVCSRV